MFVFLAYCPTEQSLTRKQFYTELFISASVRKILQTILNIVKAQKLRYSLEVELYYKLDSIVNFESGIVEMALSKKTDLMPYLDYPFFTKFILQIYFLLINLPHRKYIESS